MAETKWKALSVQDKLNNLREVDKEPTRENIHIVKEFGMRTVDFKLNTQLNWPLHTGTQATSAMRAATRRSTNSEWQHHSTGPEEAANSHQMFFNLENAKCIYFVLEPWLMSLL